MLGKSAILLLINPIQHQIDKVESGKQGRRQVDVLGHWEVRVILAADWIGRSKNTRSGIERGDDTSLGDGHGLLLHHFVQDGPGRLVHLVKFVNAADAAI